MKLLLLIVVAGMFFVSIGLADVPRPPVNQNLGMDDVNIGDMQEADCRICHSNGVPDRHHLLVDQPIPPGSLVPFPDADGNGSPDTVYGCLNCHDPHSTVVKDCAVCHTASPHHTTPAATSGDCQSCHGAIVDNMGDGHYIPTYAPSLVTPSSSGGDASPNNSRGNGAGACNYCHDDDSLSPTVILTNAELHHNASSNCTWCHDGIPTVPHVDEEHNVFHAVDKDEPFTSGCTACHGADLTGSSIAPSCYECHEDEWHETSGSSNLTLEFNIRTCEGCHGRDSLHNIQADSRNANNIGTLVVGGEDPGYGHVGRDAGPGDSDCWGCHGFAMSTSAPGAGPIIPTVFTVDPQVMDAGKDTPVTITGSSFTNIAGGELYQSDVALTATDGSSVTLTPDSLKDGALTVIVPGDTPAGNYDLRAVKAEFTSNPAVISIIPEVVITRARSTRRGIVIIDGSGFSGYAAGSGTSVTTTQRWRRARRTLEARVVSWSDTRIVAVFRIRPRRVTVNSVFGTGTSRVD